MLADLERTYLKDRDGLDDKQKKNLNHRIKNKLKLIDETLNDIRLILENYPEELVKPHVSNITVYSAASTLERVLQILDPWAIGEHEEGESRAFRVWGSAVPVCVPGKCTIDSASRTASNEEIKFHKYLNEYLNRIRLYVDPCIPDPVCRDPEYSKLQMDKLRQTTLRPFNASFNAYFDETGINESGWVLRDPVQIDKGQLQWMRWKPRGLKECMRLPPLLKEKKIPAQWITVGSISDSSTPEEIEKFNETLQKQKEGLKLTEKELSELNERIKKIPRSDEDSH
jgi:hypothetical protein